MAEVPSVAYWIPQYAKLGIDGVVTSVVTRLRTAGCVYAEDEAAPAEESADAPEVAAEIEPADASATQEA